MPALGTACRSCSHTPRCRASLQFYCSLMAVMHSLENWQEVLLTKGQASQAVTWTWKRSFILSRGAVTVLATAPAAPPAKSILQAATQTT